MPASSKATINMVENTIGSLKNCEQYSENGIKQGYYLKGEKEQIYMLFGQEKIDLFNKGDHVKSYEIKESKDMKEAMNEASGIIKDIKNVLQDLDQKAIKGLDTGIQPKQQEAKQENKGMEL